MADDKLTFFEEETQEPQETQEPEQEAQAEEPEAQEPEQKESAEESTGAKEEASPPEATTDEQGRLIPVTALLDEREKRQKFEREAEELRRWKEEQERQRQQGEKRPDFWENPEQALGHLRQEFQQQLWNEKLNISEAQARRAMGDEIVDEATEAFKAEVAKNPALFQQLQSQRDPYGFVVDWHKRQEFLSEVQDPDAWREQERERIRQELLAEVQQSKQPQKAPPPSMAKATPAGRDAIAQGSAFDDLFPET